MIRRTLLCFFALCFAGAALGQTYQPGRAPGFRPGFQFLSAAAPIIATTTWSSTDKSTRWALSSDLLTATKTSSTTGMGRATTYKSSGKSYAEIKINTVSTQLRVGAANNAAALTGGIGQDTQSLGYANDGNIYYNGSSVATVQPYVDGDIVGVLIDKNAGSVSFYLNGSFQATTTSIPAGDLTLAYGAFGGTNQSVTLNAGQNPFASPVPSGATAWG